MRTDLVMPKLGLTMTEGTVSRWVVSPGAPFSAGDIVAVVETDKIAYDLDAPASGTLTDILVPEGTTVPVGTPIGRWELTSGGVTVERPAPETVVLKVQTADTSPRAAEPEIVASPKAQGARTIATPFARRLAREARIDIASVRATNGRRIKAADVEAAIAARAASPAGQRGASESYEFIAVTAAVDRLLGLAEEIAPGQRARAPAPLDFVALAAARALAGESSDALVGLEREGAISVLRAAACNRLAVVRDSVAGSSAIDGDALLLIAGIEDALLVGRAPPAPWKMAVGVGTPQCVFRPDPNGHPALRTEITLVLSVRHRARSFDDAAALLGRLRSSLENPLLLLMT